LEYLILTGKVVLLKDLHNLSQSVQGPGTTNLSEVVDLLQANAGSTTEVVADDNSVLRAIFYQVRHHFSCRSLLPTIM